MKTSRNPAQKMILGSLFLYALASVLTANGQQVTYKDQPRKVITESPMEEDTKLIRQKMKEDGMSEAVIDKIMKQRWELSASGRKIEWTRVKRLGDNNKGTPPLPYAACGDMGGENGWGGWQAATGRYIWNSGTSPSTLSFGTPGPPVSPRFNLTSGSGVDNCTPGVGGPSIPVVAPGFGTKSIQIGQIKTSGSTGGCSTPSTAGCAEQLTYPLLVTPQDTNFIYAYAIVMQNPTGHPPVDMPFVRIAILDSLGDSINCGYYEYIAATGLPGFYSTSSACVGALYAPWNVVGINLNGYVGQVLTIVITNADCSQGGHYCQSYWDFACQNLASTTQFCKGATSVSLVAPTGTGFTYQWSTGHTTSSAIINPTITDTISVVVTPPSNCGFNLVYVMAPTEITPNFTHTVDCANKVTITNTSSITGGTISTYQWSFPSGSPIVSTAQNPVVTYPGVGTYTATLIVTSQAGCKDTVEMPITILSPPVANAGPDKIGCVGGSGVILDGSGGGTGGTYSWAPSGTLSNPNISNPVATPTVPTTYTLTVTDANGCTSQDTMRVDIGIEPEALFSFAQSYSCEGSTMTFTESSTNATTWYWDFGDGTTSTDKNPGHLFPYNGTYNVMLKVTNPPCDDDTLIPITIGDITAFITVTPTNVFTPNGDNVNDCFKPIFGGPAVAELEKCMTMEIFDRWGIKVFESTGGSNVCWDGKTKGNAKAKDGTYYYLISIGNNTYKGYVTLAREK